MAGRDADLIEPFDDVTGCKEAGDIGLLMRVGHDRAVRTHLRTRLPGQVGSGGGAKPRVKCIEL